MGRHSQPDGVPATTLGLPATNFAFQPAAEPTPTIPRNRRDVQPPRIAAPDSTTTVAGVGTTDVDSETRGDQSDVADDIRERHGWPGWVWAGLVAFWLLALGAGLVTVASLGAPHYLCTGSASTGLACNSGGTATAAVLTVVLIVAVGSVSVLAIETRTTARTAWRWLGIGVVALVVVASCGYLLIRTIGG